MDSGEGNTKPGLGWREEARTIVRAIVRDVGVRDPVLLRKALYDAYPFGKRKDYPYKAWLGVIREQIGGMRPRKADPVRWFYSTSSHDHFN